MAIAKRIFLFLTVNILVMITLSVLLNILGVNRYISAYGLDYQSLAIFCLVWGMGGAFISLAISRMMAKWMLGVQVISPNTRNPEEKALLDMVYELARSARLPAMPEVGIYPSPEVNAFATGPTKSRSLVAVSQGLLQKMNPDQIRGVLGHEVAHVANGDMVTMTLLQGVVNAFAMFLARVIAFAVDSALRGDRNESRGPSFTFFAVQMILEIVFMILGSMVVAWFSRHREFRADSGGARFAGRNSMVSALEGLQRTYNLVDPATNGNLQAFKISSHNQGWMRFFATHPPLEVRIQRLKSGR